MPYLLPIRPRCCEMLRDPDELAVIYLVLDHDGSIRSANDAALRLLRHPAHGPAGTSSLHHLVHQDDLGRVEAMMQTLQGATTRGELISKMATEGSHDNAVFFDLVLTRRPAFTEGQEASTQIVIQGWDVTSLVQRVHDLEVHAHHDALTGIANRTIFFDRLHHELRRSARSGQEIAVMFADIDDFKAVNDSHGHDVGDRVLVHVSRQLSKCLRPADTLARLGGDEFAVICPEVVSRQQANLIADRLRQAVTEPLAHAEVGVSLSIGVAFSSDDDVDDGGSALLRRADAAMYKAKRLRRV